jgi:hypothetical protein
MTCWGGIQLAIRTLPFLEFVMAFRVMAEDAPYKGGNDLI